ncbi:peptidase E [Paraburkholderia sp. GAS206C]|uniref:Type 1 glutamine amidotransferase-like domain-containing protein n=1 Tax=unclassified Paraburkholderia TaxID=2615204 RepID=UPI003D1A824C
MKFLLTSAGIKNPSIHNALVGGGDSLYLSYWMQQSGLVDLLPSLHNLVYVGLSAGSMVMASNIGEEFVHWTPLSGGDSTLGVVDF